MSFNKVILVGNLTRDPELEYPGQGGSAKTSFGIALNEKWKDKNGNKQEKAHFFDCFCWGKTAETIDEYFEKGKPILIEGSLDYRSWEAQDGSKRSKVEVKVQRFEFVGGNSDEQSGGGGRRRERVEISDSDFEDIPF